MADPKHAITLYLDGDMSFQLGRKGFAGNAPTLKIQMDDRSHAATLVLPGFCSTTKTVSLPIALQSGLFDLIDKENNKNVIVTPNYKEPGRLVVEAGARNQWFDLKVDPLDEFWLQALTPGHNYEIRWHKDSNMPWTYQEGDHRNLTQGSPVRTLSRTIKLTVLDNVTAPPHLCVSLTSTSEICHMSGEPRFGFKLQIELHEEDVITVCLDKTPLRELHGLGEISHVVDEEDEEVEWSWGIGCFEGEEPFPSDDMFEEFEAGVPYLRTFWVDKHDGELEALEHSRLYKVNISKTLLGAFTKWRRGKKKDLLAGEEDEKKDRWKKTSGPIFLETSDQFTFKTV
jgi:hypothetical protein